jgi:ACR3 family arsenite efflux pump ArsB
MAAIIVLILALIIYGLAMLVWSWLILGRNRGLKPALVATIIAIVLALATSLTLTYTTFARPHDKTGLAMLVFALYLAYGIYFVIGWAAAKRLARPRG